MHWRKLGLIFQPPTQLLWARTHAQLPYAEPVAGGLHRIHFSSRDELGRSQIGSVLFDLERPDHPQQPPDATPEIALGELGSFDDRGVTASCVVDHGGVKYQYYTGWSLGVTVPFYLGIGLAVSEDGGATYRKVSPAPVLGRTASDPYLTASPVILIEGGVWRMWFVSCVKWTMEAGKPKHHYHIRYAESKDGLAWKTDGVVCIGFADAGEYAISRPAIVRDGDLYKMWYGHRGHAYRIGYAESRDGIVWERKDSEVGIDVSPDGWDSQMMEYPHVIDHNGRRYMLYNGNTFGHGGFGLARLE